ncbi:MAG: hypothetical protein A3C42_04910 [Chlamydiae bacterium RIFCSPHIGHO2_02_FULL_45_9]|nr:MAG: hypothetical protein A3C42_04910 [Chlamydiae bacterium RIFCSPHIGHO2_02_FULL_45_9]
MGGKLYLLPNLLDDSLSIEPFLPISVNQAVREIHGLIAESEKQARRYLRKFLTRDEMSQVPLKILNEHTQDLQECIEPLKKGETWGLISDAGLPCIADPGANLVWLAHQNQIELKTFVGPSSIIIALQLSGFSGQVFSFHGYLPRDVDSLVSFLLHLEKKEGSHIWIEAPYRSQKMLDLIKKTLHPSTRLSLAVNLTTDRQRVVSQTIERWKKDPFSIDKEPAVFIIVA